VSHGAARNPVVSTTPFRSPLPSFDGCGVRAHGPGIVGVLEQFRRLP
jgi:hypothetical protein